MNQKEQATSTHPREYEMQPKQWTCTVEVIEVVSTKNHLGHAIRDKKRQPWIINSNIFEHFTGTNNLKEITSSICLWKHNVVVEGENKVMTRKIISEVEKWQCKMSSG